MDKNDMIDDDLDDLFAAAKERSQDLPDTLAARMLAAAEAAQRARRSAARDDVWSQLRALLGGWPGLSGMAAACAAGVWIGLAPPSLLPDPVDIITRAQSTPDIFPSGPFESAAMVLEDQE